MAPLPAPGITRRTLLAASAAGVALLVAGCTSSPPGGREAVTNRQADALAAQLAVQEGLVAAYAAASKADPALGTAVTELAAQAAEQLDRLRKAAPNSTPASAGATSTGAAPAGAGAKAWLRAQVGDAATSHATACLDQSGARAALLGSIAAGLRGQEGRLA
ncbi:MAG: uncharacterized protein JWQ99_802 [Blastococcus sp.]|jgi:hypothetical protein|nr:uncharacterized protein [Blastococcus sp.]